MLCELGLRQPMRKRLRRSDLRHTRYIGLAKTHLQHILTALALNLVRAVEWLTETSQTETVATKTRQSRFAALEEDAA
jgi:predicted thioredoxin/glutaredoxin